MIRQSIDRKITVLILSAIVLVYGVVNIGYANNTLYPHFHDESTTRSVAENTSAGKNIGGRVSAHSFTSLDRYVLGGPDADSFGINEDNGQLKTKSALDYETKNSYRVTITVQDGKISPLSDSITGPITIYTNKDSIDVTINVTDVANEASQSDFSYERGIQMLKQLHRMLLPKKTALLANYPNPFNPETWIPYQLAKASNVQITIYDARGTLIRQFDLGHQPAGVYQTRSRAAYWDGTNALGESVASGTYFYTLITENFSATRRMLILK